MFKWYQQRKEDFYNELSRHCYLSKHCLNLNSSIWDALPHHNSQTPPFWCARKRIFDTRLCICFFIHTQVKFLFKFRVNFRSQIWANVSSLKFSQKRKFKHVQCCDHWGNSMWWDWIESSRTATKLTMWWDCFVKSFLPTRCVFVIILNCVFIYLFVANLIVQCLSSLGLTIPQEWSY